MNIIIKEFCLICSLEWFSEYSKENSVMHNTRMKYPNVIQINSAVSETLRKFKCKA